MRDDVETPPEVTTPQEPAQPVADYSPPQIERLGTLAELTQGGTIGPDDGLGGAGDDGSV